MHFFTLVSLVTPTGALALMTPAPVNSTTIIENVVFAGPMGSADINLDSLGSRGLSKRKAMTYCANQQSTASDCKPLDERLPGTLAALLIRNANTNTCTVSSGIIDGVAYKFITAPNGDCKTTAQRGTIQCGLNRYSDYLGNQICGVHCVRLNHGGGTYRALITLGPEGANLVSVSCTSSATYVDCGNGGQNDA